MRRSVCVCVCMFVRIGSTQLQQSTTKNNHGIKDEHICETVGFQQENSERKCALYVEEVFIFTREG